MRRRKQLLPSFTQSYYDQSQHEEGLDFHVIIINNIGIKYFQVQMGITARLFILFVMVTLTVQIRQAAPGCTHPIFCNQTILKAVSKSNLFLDSKAFVDLVLKIPVEEAIQQFQTKSLQQFVKNSFSAENNILLPTMLPDWISEPEGLSGITNPELKRFGSDLNKRWNQLARRVDLSPKNRCTQQCSTFLPEIDGGTIIIPGGRFMESYYWDSYWIIKGLIVCDLLSTAENLIDNFLKVIEKYGFIPNGFRQYYLNRSQPPFLSLMVKQVVEALLSKGLIDRANSLEKRCFGALVKEHEFFMKTHSKSYRLKTNRQIFVNFYNAETTSPRPESYRQDMILVQDVPDESEVKRILKGISSMAQSGWDFSSRWLQQNNTKDLTKNIIQNIIPSDLNTLMGILETYLSSRCSKYNRTDLLVYYQRLLKDRKQYFQEIFTQTSFPDYSKQKTRLPFEVYPSDFYPFLLFPEQKVNLKNIYNATVNPTSSIYHNGMQWDSPNVWAPNNWIIHEVSTTPIGYAQEWISTTYCSWKKEGLIYQKYRNDVYGKRGQGGEYTVQTGFGWTNGLALYYLKLYGNKLIAPDCP